jgi:uncharacterized membrane protein (DUF373 family)
MPSAYSLFLTRMKNAFRDRQHQFSDSRLKDMFDNFIPYTKLAISLIIFGTILLLLAFGCIKLYEIGASLMRGGGDSIAFLHSIAIIIVVLKAYRVLVFYLDTLHVSIKYIVEISIIAPAIELIFVPQGQNLWLTAILGTFALVNLVIYLSYHERLTESDRDMMTERAIG